MPASNRPRAVWTGAISFGLVNAPVRMYTAIAEKDLRFNQLHETDGGRIGYVKVCKADNEPVPADEIVKGYEVSKGEYVRMTDEDFQAARGEQHRGITIHDFVPADQIDPIYFERTYFLGPQDGPWGCSGRHVHYQPAEHQYVEQQVHRARQVARERP